MSFMSWHSGIRAIRSYDEAVHMYNSVEPIRGTGRNAGVRPLGHRKKTHFQLVAEPGVVYAKLYRSNVVAFHEGGAITFDGNYNSQTTAKFISDVLGLHCYLSNNQLTLSYRDGAYRVQGLEMRSDNGILHVVKCTQDKVHRIDRKAMNAARKEIGEFRKYAQGMLKLFDGSAPSDTIKEALSSLNTSMVPQIQTIPTLNVTDWRMDTETHRQNLTKFMGLVKSGEAENWHQALMWMVQTGVRSIWQGRYSFYSPDVMRVLDNALIALNPHVLIEEVIPAGELKVDRYKKFKQFKGKQDDA